MPEDRPLYVMKVSTTDLFFTRCRACGELTVHGFWDQLKKETDTTRKRVVVVFTCSQCGLARRRVFRLTTSTRKNHRLVNWIKLGLRLLPYVPDRWLPRFKKLVLWLERRVPL